MADVRRGLWVAPERGRDRRTEQEGPASVPTFGEFAWELLDARRGQVADRTLETQEVLLGHVGPYFGDWRLDEIDAQAVDAYRAHKVAESEARRRALERNRPLHDPSGRALRPLAASSINKTIRFLRWALAIALEYGYVDRNAAVGRRRRLKEAGRRPVHLDTAAQIERSSTPPPNSTASPASCAATGRRSSGPWCLPDHAPWSSATCSGATSTWPTAGS
jgi:hypothetical protein